MQKKLFYVGFLVCVILGVFLFNRTSTFVSVIVPAYNAEKYIKRCLDSILSQQGIGEVIIVNDGSTDGTLKILESYAKKDSKVKIINQDNQGVSVARNKGVEAAKSKYITFVDSDDWLEPNSFSKVANLIKKDDSDVVLTGFFDVYDYEWVKGVHGEDAVKGIEKENKFRNKNLDDLALLSPFNGKEAHSDLFYVGGGVRARFFRNNFIKTNNITFPADVHCYEDDVFLYKAFLNNPKISILNEPIYNYSNRLDSISKSKDVLVCGEKSLEFMKNTQEYKQATRREKMLISDSFVAYLFLSVANMRRSKQANINVGSEAKKIYDSFAQYNRQELKSCRNYNILKKKMFPSQLNQNF